MLNFFQTTDDEVEYSGKKIHLLKPARQNKKTGQRNKSYAKEKKSAKGKGSKKRANVHSREVKGEVRLSMNLAFHLLVRFT